MGCLSSIKFRWALLRFTLSSLTHDTCRSPGFYTDAAFEPVFWIIDHVAGVFGLVFLVMVTALTSSVVLIWYKYLLPIILTRSRFWIVFHALYSHWLLVNIVFHYFQAVFTDPGLPPQGKPMDEVKGAVICKKCVQPKPQRTHHCSVCNRCIMKMDHHCPWMNNCIGFYNHRFFILFCWYMWLGTVYICLTSWDPFVYHFFNPENLLDEGKRNATLSVSFGFGSIINQVMGSIGSNKDVLRNSVIRQRHPSGSDDIHPYEHIAVIYLFLLCSAVTVALGLLNLWHMRLIWKGQTSIEVHINHSERRKAAKKDLAYHNPHDFGWKKNFKTILGLSHGRSIACVLFPSNHKPQGDGMTWPPNSIPTFYYDPCFNRKVGLVTRLRRWCPL